MPEADPFNDVKKHIRLRGAILEMLYEIFREYPYLPVELDRIAETCHMDAGTLNWNIVYLEKCGYVELSKSDESPPYIACWAAITADGIDMVEDRKEFNKRFNPN